MPIVATMWPAMWHVLRIGVLVIVVLFLVNQVRKPSPWIGRLFLSVMNRSHSALTDWALAHIDIGRDFRILDVGCGGGATLAKLAAIATDGHVSGVDYSVASVEASRATNARMIEAGRVDVRQASVSRLPFPDSTFDLVTAIETHYYWPDLPRDILEVRRVLKPGGRFVVVAESYQGGRFDLAQGLAMKLLRATLWSLEEHRRWFAAAEFSDLRLIEDRAHGWMCAIGALPGSNAALGGPVGVGAAAAADS